MDEITHDVRWANWLSIIRQCQNRPEGITVKQWMADHGIRSKSYYYWLRKFRKESYKSMQPCNDITLHEMQFPVPQQKSVAGDGREFSGNADVAVIVSQGNTVITVTNWPSQKNYRLGECRNL